MEILSTGISFMETLIFQSIKYLLILKLLSLVKDEKLKGHHSLKKGKEHKISRSRII